MDPASSSEPAMGAQPADPAIDLDRCVEVAERSALLLMTDPPPATPAHTHTRPATQHQIAREGFPRFRDLPPELRSKVWQHAMPPCGLYTVLMLGREEPRPQQPPAPAPLAFRVVYRLEPLPRDQQDGELRFRLDTVRAVQRACSEAAAEVGRAFPTTISCTGGQLRFDADRDILGLSDLPCPLSLGFMERFRRYHQGAVAFAHDWHKTPRKMVMTSLPLCKALCHVGRWLRLPASVQSGLHDTTDVEGFLKFLADCTRLDMFGLLYADFHTHKIFIPPDLMPQFRQVVSSCHYAPCMPEVFYTGHTQSQANAINPVTFATCLEGLSALIHGLRAGQDCADKQLQSMFGRPELQHLQLRAMFPAVSYFWRFILQQDGIN